MDFENVTQFSSVTFNRVILWEWAHLRRKSRFCELIHATGLLDDLCTEPHYLTVLFLIYRYNVAWLIPVIPTISLILYSFESYNFKAFSILLSLTFGLPPFLPLALALSKPSFVLCAIISLSN